MCSFIFVLFRALSLRLRVGALEISIVSSIYIVNARLGERIILTMLCEISHVSEIKLVVFLFCFCISKLWGAQNYFFNVADNNNNPEEKGGLGWGWRGVVYLIDYILYIVG